ncbi:MAG: long-chain fatty acid--CoA ligase [Chloroflexi bacterium]|nr:MAG: long-chain fatty acid--CoA ligase [Chloroflexota bacterium]
MEKPWLKHYDEGVPATIDYPSIPLDQFLTDAAAKHPDHAAIVFGAALGSRVMDAQLTYGQLDDAVNRFAAGLQKMGVQKGDRVAIMLPNCPQFVIAAYGTWRIGGIVVCCNPLYVPREVEHLVNDSGTETIVVMSSLYERVKSIRAATGLKRVIVTNIKEYFPGLLKFLFTLAKEKKEGHRVEISDDADTYWFQSVLQSTAAQPAPVKIEPEEVATLIYTGGTTGVPKGAQLTHHNLVSNATLLNVWSKSKEAEDVMIACMPYFHVYGLTAGMNTPIANALTIVQIPNPRDMVHVLKSIEKHRATYYPGVPTMFIGFNNFPTRDEYDLTSLRFAVSAAAPLPPEVQQKFETITGGKMVEAYGLTETSPAACMDPIEHPRARSIGVPVPDTELKIVDADTGTQEMEVGEVGEIIIKGPQVMKGYWNMPTETANAIRTGPDGQTGWFYSGDIGYMDEDGYFHITDRKKDIIIAGGYNIYPADVEAVLFEHAAVKEAAVVGVVDPRQGESVKAFIVLKEGESATKDEIIAFCRERLAIYKAPRFIEFRDDLPKSIIGKVLRRSLRDEEAQSVEK